MTCQAADRVPEQAGRRAFTHAASMAGRPSSPAGGYTGRVRPRGRATAGAAVLTDALATGNFEVRAESFVREVKLGKDGVEEIIEIRGSDGGPPYLVRRDDGHEALLYPGADCELEHAHRHAAH